MQIAVCVYNRMYDEDNSEHFSIVGLIKVFWVIFWEINIETLARTMHFYRKTEFVELGKLCDG